VLKILPADDAAAIAAIIQNIDDSSAEISMLIERVSLVLRASSYPFDTANVEMGEVVANVLDQLDADIRKANATVKLPTSWPAATGVTKWLEAIWLNLVSNALRHGGPAAQIRIAWTREGAECRYCVYNNGEGISPRMKAALFLPFEQLHTLHTAGLGLAIVRRLISLQGGRCGYEQTPGAETCFYFTLPASSSPQTTRDTCHTG
jgi:two-component system OmpR family sensor kinase